MRRIAKGTELKGTTTDHPGRIVVIGITDRKYRVRFKGGQHNGGAVERLEKYVVEMHYEIVKLPKR